MNDKAQLHTLEGLAAALLMTLTILTITQSAMIITPQNELVMDVQLKQIASDALTVLDSAPEATIRNDLTECIASWDENEASLDSNNLEMLDYELSYLLPDILYNVNIAYVNATTQLTDKKVIVNGAPTENAVVARRLVSLSNSTVSSSGGEWNIADDELLIVEVRLTAWRV
ncbi:hypothetical protein [Methanolobus sp.]|uniref:DUF7288 family protein n=1 Tax=Methanolobus sp. TaxID=1874737 RepID=UPI0025CCE89E|nr:hypothetical protein [Methanolobus sp.]